MCGFIGECGDMLLDEISFGGLLQLSEMRGPDSHGFYREENKIQLGFNRLSIIDVSENGSQPYHSPSGNFSFVFNGEIYNCEQLITKYDLDRTKFRSTADTEVIAHLLDTLAIGDLAKALNGMYAIAAYDKRNDKLYLLRDFAGIKPLFYGLHKQGVVFASQFNQVYKHALISKEIKVDPEILKEYFALGYMQAPNTVYQNIKQVSPGEVVIYDLQTKEISKTGFVTFESKQKGMTRETNARTIDRVNDILKDVVKRQLISDVPIGTFLSGGIDSPIITAIASEQKAGIEAFTVKIDDKRINESEIAAAYAAHLGVKNIVAPLSNDDIIKLIDEHFRFFPEPFGDYSSIPTYLICKLARKKFSVLLSGDGGDELFWGYPRFFNTRKHARWFALPRTPRRILARAGRTLGQQISYGVSASSIGEWVLGQQAHNKPEVVDTFFKKETSFSKELKNFYHYRGSKRNAELMQWLRRNEFYCHMQRVLVKVDRASMGSSLEVRVPFLDKDLIDYAFLLEPDPENETPKYVLKKVMERYFPGSIINREKMGFTVDIETILKQHCKADILGLIKSDKIVGRELLNMETIEKYINAYFSGTHNNHWGIWIIYAYFKWSVMHNT
jgi:asparagine synthase (glutamine-hydrolysing)